MTTVQISPRPPDERPPPRAPIHEPRREGAAFVRLRLAATPDSVRVVRRALADLCQRLGVGAARAGEIRLAVTEACTNVVLHAYGHEAARGLIEVDARRADGALVVIVRDYGSGLAPRPDSPGLGIGLSLMALLSSRFEVRRDPSDHNARRAPASSAQTQERLGWRPTQPGLISDLDRDGYFEPAASSP